MKQKLNILLVEDNPGDVMLIEELLLEGDRFSFNMISAETLKAGLELSQNDDLDIVLLDLGLPDSQGLEALETMLEKVNHLPVVVITGLDDGEVGRKAINLGAQNYIIKGLTNPRLISDSITHAIERNKILLELKEKDIELKAMNARLKKANLAREGLIALLSHDLRGPVMTVVSFLELLLKDFGDFDDERKIQILNTCVKSGKSTVELLESLLDWARLQSDEKIIQAEKTALNSFIDKSLEPLMAMAAQKNVVVRNHTSKDHSFYADADMIATVVRNLLTNAIKFTPTNGTVTVQSEHTVHGGVLISVEDTGVGIGEGDIHKIFDISAGFTTPGTENEKGTGFGMVLCKEFVEKNNGKIKIESEIGKGTVIRVELPAENTSLENVRNGSDMYQ